MPASYPFKKSKDHFRRTIYHDIYCDDGILIFKVKKKVQNIIDWLGEFHGIMDKALGNQNLQFTAEMWTNNENLPPSEKEEKFHICADDGLLFLDMNMSWSLKRDLQFRIFSKKRQKLKYFIKCSTNTPGKLCVIHPGVLKCLGKITFA